MKEYIICLPVPIAALIPSEPSSNMTKINNMVCTFYYVLGARDTQCKPIPGGHRRRVIACTRGFYFPDFANGRRREVIFQNRSI
ncbi:MAG: hypothetical protein Q8O41_09650 [Candidatus Methanoperedens sp.]|nr:hypothetical protein [Candidatus Methanoperedens sp.]